MNGGKRREALFADDQDRQGFLQTLGKGAIRPAGKCWHRGEAGALRCALRIAGRAMSEIRFRISESVDSG